MRLQIGQNSAALIDRHNALLLPGLPQFLSIGKHALSAEQDFRPGDRFLCLRGHCVLRSHTDPDQKERPLPGITRAAGHVGSGRSTGMPVMRHTDHYDADPALSGRLELFRISPCCS